MKTNIIRLIIKPYRRLAHRIFDIRNEWFFKSLGSKKRMHKLFFRLSNDLAKVVYAPLIKMTDHLYEMEMGGHSNAEQNH